MAPMTRSHALVPRSDTSGRSQNSREASWQFVESETRSERALSEEPPSSYDEEQDMEDRFEEEEAGDSLDFEKKPPLTTADDNDDVLHPLRAAANRVGHEVERFAEILDGYNPQRAVEYDEKQEMMFDLISLYRVLALETAERLREKHASERRKQDGTRWRKKIRGFKVTPDDEMDLEDSDEQESPLSDSPTTLADLERWEQEAQTWDLLQRLVHLRFGTSQAETSMNSVSRSKKINQFSSEREIWDEFLETDSLALERRTVLQWLKESADDSGEDIDILVQDLQQNADRGDIIAHGWLHTKSAIKNHKRKTAWTQALDPKAPSVDRVLLNGSKTEPLATQLDPDSATRQKRRLESQDEYFERAIWLGCYEMLRRGKGPHEIREWCMERTEVWRAISMSGFPDDSLEDLEDQRDPDATLLWRRMCFALARKGGGDEYERAVYGILSGDVSSVEPVCRSWEDFMFIHYNALLRSQFENYLRGCHPQWSLFSSISPFGVFDAVQFHGEPSSAGSRLIETLKADPRVAAETKKPMKMLQGVLIANQFSNFIYQQGLAISKFANTGETSNLFPPNKQQPENEDVTKYIQLDDHDSLRVLTHILLVFMGLGLDLGGVFRETEVENVIVAYISFLRLAGKEELIPLYCSQLSGKRKYAILCRSLIDVTAHDQRVTQIKLMRELGLDVQEFVGLQARFLLSDYPDQIAGYPASGNFKLLSDPPNAQSRKVRRDYLGDDDSVERVDLLLIRSLQWYLLVDGLWSETFTIGTMLYLRFFKNMHLAAARALSVHVPSHEIALRKTRAILGQSIDFRTLESGEDEDLTEVLGGSADQKRLLKNHLLAEAKNFRELEVLMGTLDIMETCSSLEAILEENPTASRQSDWRKSLAEACYENRQVIPSLFRGWLLTSQREGEEAEFKRLREAYLPETILAYIITLEFAGAHLTRDFLMEAMDISSVVAEENSDVLELFMKAGRLKELVDVLAHASKTLLFISSSKHGSGSKKKKTSVRGWSPQLWSVKP